MKIDMRVRTYFARYPRWMGIEPCIGKKNREREERKREEWLACDQDVERGAPKMDGKLLGVEVSFRG